MTPFIRVIVVGLLLFPTAATAQSRNDIQVSVAVNVTREGSDYVYDYTLTNASRSRQPAERLVLEVDARAKITPLRTPEGWTFGVYSNGPFVRWAATGGIDGEEAIEGPIPPSPFVIRPGATLGGFRIRSPFPDRPVQFYVEGYIAVPIVDDVEDLPPDLMRYLTSDFKQRAFSGTTRGPKSSSDCDAQGGDADADAICDAVDNCPLRANPDQRNGGGVARGPDLTGATPDGIGDACQCGDVNDDGRVNQDDVMLLEEAIAAGRSEVPGDLKCSVSGPASTSGFPDDCDASDAALLRQVLTSGMDTSLIQFCEAAFPMR